MTGAASKIDHFRRPDAADRPRRGLAHRRRRDHARAGEDAVIHCATSVVIASALSLALMFWQSTPAQSDEATQMVRVACDARHETVFVDGIVLYKGEPKHDFDNTILYDIGKLPQYSQHKPGQVVCDFGLNKKVLLTAGTSPVAERNNNVSH